MRPNSHRRGLAFLLRVCCLCGLLPAGFGYSPTQAERSKYSKITTQVKHAVQRSSGRVQKQGSGVRGFRGSGKICVHLRCHSIRVLILHSGICILISALSVV